MSTNDCHVIFGTGPVGLAIMDELIAKNKPVRLVNRRGQANVPDRVEIMAGDASDPECTRELCKGAAVVYNCTNLIFDPPFVSSFLKRNNWFLMRVRPRF